jgi:deoxyribodipyrimidine photo-lyase
MVNPKRVHAIREGSVRGGPVAYWMSRDQRASDNWALLYAQQVALDRQLPLLVVFCLAPSFLGATRRQYAFLLRGLQEVEANLAEHNIPFHLLKGSPAKELPAFVAAQGVGQLVSDFDPLRIKRLWKDAVAKGIDIPFFEVDAHNIIPCWVASTKQEYAARTMRPKIHGALGEFLQPFPPLEKHPWPGPGAERIDWSAAAQTLRVDESVPQVHWLQPGQKAGRGMLQAFLQGKLIHYSQRRNDPSQDGQSNLSPYLHFGHISAQRVALEVDAYSLPHEVKADFFEELVVRRELSDNYCFYNLHYDSFAGFPEWGQKTLSAHRQDPRQYVYSMDEFEQGQTHDELWNAAQMEMVTRGKMHGYMRMYWAKKILEWSESAEKALDIAIALNDKYELDGRDPNGYTGIAWSIGGLHDRPWKERAIFGTIRYMSHGGARRKFDIQAYVQKHVAGQG